MVIMTIIMVMTTITMMILQMILIMLLCDYDLFLGQGQVLFHKQKPNYHKGVQATHLLGLFKILQGSLAQIGNQNIVQEGCEAIHLFLLGVIAWSHFNNSCRKVLGHFCDPIGFLDIFTGWQRLPIKFRRAPETVNISGAGC